MMVDVLVDGKAVKQVYEQKDLPKELVYEPLTVESIMEYIKKDLREQIMTKRPTIKQIAERYREIRYDVKPHIDIYLQLFRKHQWYNDYYQMIDYIQLQLQLNHF